jgi:hypothetical protein
MKQREKWRHVFWGAWGLLSIWTLGFSSPANIPERTTLVLGAAMLAFAAIAALAPEARMRPPTAFLGLALLAAPPVLDVNSPEAVSSSAVIVAALVLAVGVWAFAMYPLFYLRARRWQMAK